MSIKNIVWFAAGVLTGGYAVYKCYENGLLSIDGESHESDDDGYVNQLSLRPKLNKLYNNLFDTEQFKNLDMEDTENAEDELAEVYTVDGGRVAGVDRTPIDDEAVPVSVESGTDGSYTIKNDSAKIPTLSNEETADVVITPENDDGVEIITGAEFVFHRSNGDSVLEFGYDVDNGGKFINFKNGDTVKIETMRALFGVGTINKLVGVDDESSLRDIYVRRTADNIYMSLVIL